jgi:hypothetical protein
VESKKFKYIFGEPTFPGKATFDGINPPDGSIEGNVICGNDKWIAMPWKSSGGGIVAVHPANQFGKLNPSMPLITGHKGVVQDLCFSPFHDNILATASADGSLKLWMIPDAGLTENLTKYDADLKGHTKKVSLMKWHPTANFTIGSTSLDGTFKIWDIQSEKCTMSYDNIGEAPWSMEWNHNGSMMATIDKSKKMHIFDPR